MHVFGPFFLLISFIPFVKSSCPQYYDSIDDSICYRLLAGRNNKDVDWHTAKTDCAEDHGSFLADITYEHVPSIIKLMGNGKWVWIGLIYNETLARWQWLRQPSVLIDFDQQPHLKHLTNASSSGKCALAQFDRGAMTIDGANCDDKRTTFGLCAKEWELCLYKKKLVDPKDADHQSACLKQVTDKSDNVSDSVCMRTDTFVIEGTLPKYANVCHVENIDKNKCSVTIERRPDDPDGFSCQTHCESSELVSNFTITDDCTIITREESCDCNAGSGYAGPASADVPARRGPLFAVIIVLSVLLGAFLVGALAGLMIKWSRHRRRQRLNSSGVARIKYDVDMLSYRVDRPTPP